MFVLTPPQNNEKMKKKIKIDGDNNTMYSNMQPVAESRMAQQHRRAVDFLSCRYRIKLGVIRKRTSREEK